MAAIRGQRDKEFIGPCIYLSGIRGAADVCGMLVGAAETSHVQALRYPYLLGLLLLLLRFDAQP